MQTISSSIAKMEKNAHCSLLISTMFTFDRWSMVNAVLCPKPLHSFAFYSIVRFMYSFNVAHHIQTHTPYTYTHQKLTVAQPKVIKILNRTENTEMTIIIIICWYEKENAIRLNIRVFGYEMQGQKLSLLSIYFNHGSFIWWNVGLYHFNSNT